MVVLGTTKAIPGGALGAHVVPEMEFETFACVWHTFHPLNHLLEAYHFKAMKNLGSYDLVAVNYLDSRTREIVQG